MDEQNMFNKNERTALVSLLIEMVNADHEVVFEELIQTNHINTRFGITSDDFVTGKALDPIYALYIVKNMTDDQKRLIAQLLVEVIDADGIDSDEEISLLNFICDATGLTPLFP
ncbi:MAG: TerB family tellurite resistance protein [Muribaculaceae bacterium]|nr:TerB family tellurite resistance protein [Muribaculaceae bacterium]